MTLPPALQSAREWADDRLGPIVVKEARQAVRSRFVVAVQFLFLALLVVSLGGVLLSHDGENWSRDLGRNVFYSFCLMLHGVCVLCVPMYVGVRMAAERQGDNVDLLFSTTIKPWSVVLGKLASGLMLGLLAMSACAPFMVLCYFLRGVDLPTIAFALERETEVLVAATLVAVFVGALPVGAVIKGVAALACLVLALASFNWLVSLMLRSMMRGGSAAAMVSSPQARINLAVGMLVGVGVCGLLFVMTSAMLSPPTSNRALPVRLYLTLAWGLSAMVAILLNFGMINSNFTPFKSWAVAWSILLALATLVAGSERDKLGPRVLAQIPRHPKGNMGAFLLYSGSAGGLFWVACMTFGTLLFSLAASYTLDWLFRRPVGDVAGVRDLVLRLGVANVMTLGYVLLAGCLRRKLAPQATKPFHTGFIAAGMMLFALVVPVVVSFLSGGAEKHRYSDDFWPYILFPFSSVFYRPGDAGYGPVFFCSTAVAVALLSVGFLCALPWMLGQARVFYTAGAADAAPQTGDDHA